MQILYSFFFLMITFLGHCCRIRQLPLPQQLMFQCRLQTMHSCFHYHCIIQVKIAWFLWKVGPSIHLLFPWMWSINTSFVSYSIVRFKFFIAQFATVGLAWHSHYNLSQNCFVLLQYCFFQEATFRCICLLGSGRPYDLGNDLCCLTGRQIKILRIKHSPYF